MQLQTETTTSIQGPWWKLLIRAIPASYRPELHYMRGPGPKWREKHCDSEFATVPSLPQTANDHREVWSGQSHT